MLKLPNPLNWKKMSSGSCDFSWNVTKYSWSGEQRKGIWGVVLAGMAGLKGTHLLLNTLQFGYVWIMDFKISLGFENPEQCIHNPWPISFIVAFIFRESVVLHLQWIDSLLFRLSHFIRVMKFIHLMVNIFSPQFLVSVWLRLEGCIFKVLVCTPQTVQLFNAQDVVLEIYKYFSCVITSAHPASLSPSVMDKIENYYEEIISYWKRYSVVVTDINYLVPVAFEIKFFLLPEAAEMQWFLEDISPSVQTKDFSV